jgi:hypothetical protein
MPANSDQTPAKGILRVRHDAETPFDMSLLAGIHQWFVQKERWDTDPVTASTKNQN